MSNQISADSSTSSMWGGRFSEATDSFVAEFTCGGFDNPVIACSDTCFLPCFAISVGVSAIV